MNTSSINSTIINTKDLIRIGVPAGEPIQLAHEFIQNFIAQGNEGARLEAEVFNIKTDHGSGGLLPFLYNSQSAATRFVNNREPGFKSIPLLVP